VASAYVKFARSQTVLRKAVSPSSRHHTVPRLYPPLGVSV